MKKPLPSHPTHPLYSPGMVQPYQVPATLAFDWSQIRNVPPFPPPPLLYPEAVEETWPIPGPPGVAGAAGSAGAAGVAGALGPRGFDGDAGEDAWIVPGPAGPQGIQGIPGVGGGGGSTYLMLPTIEERGNDDDALAYLGAAACKVGGKGTLGAIPKWTSAVSLGDSVLSEAAGILTSSGELRVSAAILRVTGGVNPFVNLFDGTTDGYLQIASGKLSLLMGTKEWTLNTSGVWAPGTDATHDVGATAQRVRDIFFSQSLSQGTNAVVLDASGGTLRIAIGSGWTKQEFYTGGTLRWYIDSAGILTASTGAYIWDNNTPVVAADQATFVNVQTNITSMSYAQGINQVWEVDIVLSVTMGVAATGVKFYFTGPAGMTGEIHYEGNVATVATWQSLYQAVLTVPGTFFVTGIITGTYKLRATVRTAGTPGTIQLVGITGGATTTCAVKKGSQMRARRSL